MLTKEQVEKLNLAAPETIDYLVRTLGSEGEYVHIWGSFGFLCEAALELYIKLEKAEVEIAELREAVVSFLAFKETIFYRMSVNGTSQEYNEPLVRVIKKLQRLVEGKDERR